MFGSIKYLFALIIAAGVLSLSACNQSSSNNSTMTDTTQNAKLPAASAFEKTIDGKQTHLFVLKNARGMEAAITNYGGRLVGLLMPGKNGKLVDIVEGFSSVEGYQKSTEPYFGATIGRYGNRIAKGKFTLEGKTYTLCKNNGPNTLHGGKPGFQDVVWDAKQPDSNTLRLTYFSKDMEGGFPGNVHVTVTYYISEDNALRITYEATTDKTTVINLTNHAFFNLNGAGSGTILNHTVQIFADFYTPVDSTLIPTGKLDSVHGTPFDFTAPTTIGARINDKNQQLKDGKGYDHNFVLNKHQPTTPVAFVTGDKTGIELAVLTDEPGLQFYSGNFMQSKNTMKNGNKDNFRTAFAMETQHFPDSPNQPNFPSTILKPGVLYQTGTEYKLQVVK
jgi:aldose 1-epimerase